MAGHMQPVGALQTSPVHDHDPRLHARGSAEVHRGLGCAGEVFTRAGEDTTGGEAVLRFGVYVRVGDIMATIDIEVTSEMVVEYLGDLDTEEELCIIVSNSFSSYREDTDFLIAYMKYIKDNHGKEYLPDIDDIKDVYG